MMSQHHLLRAFARHGGISSFPAPKIPRRTDPPDFPDRHSDRHYPKVSKIVLVQDNLSTHTMASLYAAFAPAEARRLTERFEVHYTPKDGSWLDMAESELAVLSSQCLDRRIPDKDSLIKEVDAWQTHRNKHHTKANWQFTNDAVRVKLRHLYPSI